MIAGTKSNAPTVLPAANRIDPTAAVTNTVINVINAFISLIFLTIHKFTDNINAIQPFYQLFLNFF